MLFRWRSMPERKRYDGAFKEHAGVNNTAEEINMAEEPLYPAVNIINSTTHAVTGTVVYAACSDDDFKIAAGPGTSWTGPYRGGCLITEISAQIAYEGTFVEATPYESSGTSYSEFAVIQQNQKNPPGFEVTRRTTKSEEAREQQAAE